MKNQYRGEDCLKRWGLGQFIDLWGGGGVAKKKEWCFKEWVNTQMHTMSYPKII